MYFTYVVVLANLGVRGSGPYDAIFSFGSWTLTVRGLFWNVKESKKDTVYMVYTAKKE